MAQTALSTMKQKSSFIKHFLEVDKELSHSNIFDIWINTTHVHGSTISFTEQLERLSRLTQNDRFRRMYVLLHNKQDMHWFIAIFKGSPLGLDRIQPVCLSHDVQFSLWQISGILPGIFTPYILDDCSLLCQQTAKELVLGKSGEIKLLIIGLCRRGKMFPSISYFKDLIDARSVSFSYAGWVPKGAAKESGLWEAVNNGFIKQLCISSSRIEDTDMNRMILGCDAIVDLKIPQDGKRSYVSSGNIGASIAFTRPLVAHRSNYPGTNCIRFVDYDDLYSQLSSHNIFRDDLLLHKNILQHQQQVCYRSNRLLFEN